MIIDWKKIAEKLYNDIKQEVSTLEKKPTLWAILVWDNSSSLKYIWQKRKWADFTWINFNLKHLDKNITEEELLKIINEFNASEDISWYIVQLPLPDQIDSKKNNICNITKKRCWLILPWKYW